MVFLLCRACNILLYANYVIKWSGTYSGMLPLSTIVYEDFCYSTSLHTVFTSIGVLTKGLQLQMQLAGANTALALAMTVVSNLLGILIVSFIVSVSCCTIILEYICCFAALDLGFWWFCKHLMHLSFRSHFLYQNSLLTELVYLFQLSSYSKVLFSRCWYP